MGSPQNCCFLCGSSEQPLDLLSVSSSRIWEPYKDLSENDFLDTVLTALDLDSIAEVRPYFLRDGFCQECLQKLVGLCNVSLQIQQLMETLKQMRLQCWETLKNNLILGKDSRKYDDRKQMIQVLEDRLGALKELDLSTKSRDDSLLGKDISIGSKDSLLELSSLINLSNISDVLPMGCEDLEDYAAELTKAASILTPEVPEPPYSEVHTSGSTGAGLSEMSPGDNVANDVETQLSILERMEKIPDVEDDRPTLIDEQLRLIPKVKLHQCNICSKTFRKKTKYDDHQNMHQNIRPYKCDKCIKCFFDRNNLADHKRLRHRNQEITCTVCCKTFRDNKSYSKHVRVSHTTDPFTCSVCHQNYTSYQEYRNHVKTHPESVEEDQLHVCSICDKVYSSAYYLKSHMRIHTGEKLFECSEVGCDYKTPSKSHLKIHLRKHETSQELQCTKCSKKYKNTAILRRHKQFDCGNEFGDSLKCSYCSKRFKSRNNLLTHENNIHKLVGRPWLCPQCGKTFKIKKEYHSHVSRCHLKVGSETSRTSIQTD